MSARDGAGWVRVGELLQVRRVELAPRYKNLALFCRERDIDYRLAWDIENHARTNFRRGTRTSIEVAYGWEPGSIERVLAGAEPTVRSDGAPVRELELVPRDEFEEAALSADRPYPERLAAVRQHRELLDELGITGPPSLLRAAIQRKAGEPAGTVSDAERRRGA
jgi:hypothetical protein